MSCTITYNNQIYTEEDFLEYLKSQIENESSNSQGTINVYWGQA